jgi:hypothetical protein
MIERNSSPASSMRPGGSRIGHDHAALEQATQQAEAFYGSGEWAQAERICQSILAADSDHFVALYLLGVIAAQT